MDRLSSCYFCGDALDAALDEYPVVPQALDPDDSSQRTVVLCGDCRRKLEAVLESVVAAAESTPGDASAGDAQSAGTADGAETPAGTESDDAVEESGVESTLEGGEDVLRSVGDDSDEDHDDEMEWVQPGAEGGPERNGAEDDDAGGEAASAAEGDDSDVGAAEADGAGADDGSDGDDDADASEGRPAGAADPDDGASLTRLEYNRVMRLLQNREFPVEREGFVTVAANAYELSHGEVETVLDVAIEKGLIDQREGDIVDAE